MEYSDQPRIDLHIHSYFSDGTFSPQEILNHAGELGLAAIAITDHDTIDGSRELLKLSSSSSVHCLSGVELSAEPSSFSSSDESMHILGYGFNIEHPPLLKMLKALKNFRKTRIPKILNKLNDLGLKLEEGELYSCYRGKANLGRPHIANFMVRKGYVGTIDDAFNRYLKKGQPAYIAKPRIPCAEAIRAINDARGLAVLAHPLLAYPELASGDPKGKFKEFMKTLQGEGIVGIEAYYPDHSAEQTRFFIDLADELGLLVTGGTDFHGAIIKEIKLGSGRGDLKIPFALYENIVGHNKG